MTQEIKRGDVFKCWKDYEMDDERLAFKAGDKYKSLRNGTLKSIIDNDHLMTIDEEFLEHFTKDEA